MFTYSPSRLLQFYSPFFPFGCFPYKRINGVKFWLSFSTNILWLFTWCYTMRRNIHVVKLKTICTGCFILKTDQILCVWLPAWLYLLCANWHGFRQEYATQTPLVETKVIITWGKAEHTDLLIHHRLSSSKCWWPNTVQFLKCIIWCVQDECKQQQ